MYANEEKVRAFGIAQVFCKLCKKSWRTKIPFPISAKDLSRVKPDFKSIPPQFHFEIARLASAEKWREI